MGLGHIQRDLTIVSALRRLKPGTEAVWLTAEPNLTFLREVSEVVHGLSSEMMSPTESAERGAHGSFSFDSHGHARRIQEIQRHNSRVLIKVLEEMEPALVFADEAVEVLWVLAEDPQIKHWPLVIMTDALYPISAERPQGFHPTSQWRAYLQRRRYVRYFREFKASGFEPYLMLYVGRDEDVPDEGMGLGLPQLRDFFLEHFQSIGYVIPFDRNAVVAKGKTQLKSELGYAPSKKLIIASIGGTALGRELLERVDQAASQLNAVAGGALQIVLVCGPRLPPESLHVESKIVSVHGYVPRLYLHLAAADFAIIKTGLASAIELAAAGTPFVHVPIPGHVEEEYEVASRLKHLGLGEEVKFSEMSLENLAACFKRALDKPMNLYPFPFDGAEVAAKMILKMLTENRSQIQAPPAAVAHSD